jgi:hypothetical protein
MSCGASGGPIKNEVEQQEHAPASSNTHLSFRVVTALRAASALTAIPAPLRPFKPDLSDSEKVSLKFTLSLCSASFGMEFWNQLSPYENTDSRRRVLAEWKPSRTSCYQQFDGDAIGFAACRESDFQLLWGNPACPTATIKKNMRRNVDGDWQESRISVFLFPVNKRGNKAGILHCAEFSIDLSVSPFHI